MMSGLLDDKERLTSELMDARQTIARLQAENARLCADAERWRWARQHPDWLGWDADYLPDSIDKTIDAARAAKEER